MSSDQHRKKRLLIVLFVRFLAMLGFGIVIPVLPFLVNTLGGNAFMMGLFMAVYSIMQFIFAPYWGQLSDRIGRKPVLLAGLTGYGITFILFGLVQNLWLLIVIRAVSGIVSSATLPTTMAYIADSTDGNDRAKYLGFMGAASGMGMIIGPALGGVLSVFGYHFSFIFAGVLCLAIVPLAFYLLPESLSPDKRRAGGAPPQRLSAAVLRDALITVYLVNFIAYFSLSIFEATFAYFGNLFAGMTARDMGFVFVVIGLVSVVIQMRLIAVAVQRLGEVRLLLAGNLLSAFGFVLILVMARTHNLLLIVLAAAVYYAGNAFITPTASALVSKHSHGHQGQAMGYFSSFGSLGRMIGPLAGGALYDVSPTVPYLFGSLMLVATVLLLAPAMKRMRWDASDT